MFAAARSGRDLWRFCRRRSGNRDARQRRASSHRRSADQRVIADHHEYEIVFHRRRVQARRGVDSTEQALQANPDVDAIVAANDDMAFGAAEAVAGAGLDIPIIGFDALPEALQAVEDGTLAATVEQFPGGQTSGAMEVLVNYLRDGTEPAEHTTLIEPALITAENVGEAERAERLASPKPGLAPHPRQRGDARHLRR